MTLFFTSRMLGSFLALVTFMVLPRIMDPVEYGQLNIAVQIGTAGFGLLLGWIPAAMVRFHKASGMDGMSTSWLLGAGCLGAVAIIALSVIWVAFGGGFQDLPVFPILVFGLGHGLNEIGLAGLRAYGHAKRFAICVLFRPIGGLILVAGILTLGVDPSMTIIGLGVAAGLSGIWAIIWLVRQSPPALPNVENLTRLLSFGLPLAFVAAGASLNAVITQSILAHQVGLAAVGTFAAAMTLAMRSISMTMIMLGRTVSPTIYEAYEDHGHEKSDAAFERYASFLLLLSIPLVLILTVGAVPVSRVLFDDNFRAEVGAILPWVAVTAFVGGLQGSYLSYVFSIAEKTWMQLLLLSGALVIHAIVTFLMVAGFGAIGAAYGSLLSAALSLFAYGFFANRIRAVNVPLGELGRQFKALCVATPFALLTIFVPSTVLALTSLTLTICVYLLTLYLSRQIAIRVVVKRVRNKLQTK